MSGMARAIIVGRLTRDAELKYATGGTAVLSFAIATSRKTKDGERPSFWDCDLFGLRAEKLAQYMKKGVLVSLDGEQYQDSWEKDGIKHNKTRITAADVQLLGGNQAQGVAPAAHPAAPASDFPDDIPF